MSSKLFLQQKKEQIYQKSWAHASTETTNLLEEVGAKKKQEHIYQNKWALVATRITTKLPEELGASRNKKKFIGWVGR